MINQQRASPANQSTLPFDSLSIGEERGKLYQNRDWLKDRYIKEKLNSVEIAKLADTQSNVIMVWLRRYKIALRPQGWWFKGKKRTKKEKNKMSDTIKEGYKNGRIVWNKGKERPEMKGENNANYGGKYTKLESVRNKISDANKGRKIGEEEMQRRLKSWNRKPSGLEKFFDKITPRIVRYTGDGSWWRKLPNGKYKNPDFKIKGQNKVIELFGDYWHRNDNPQELIELYNQLGLQCIVIWEHEVYKNKEGIMERVNKFIFLDI